MKGLLRFALIGALSTLLAPYLNRLFDRLAARFADGSVWQETFDSLSKEYSTSLIRSFGESVGELVLGPASAKKR